MTRAGRHPATAREKRPRRVRHVSSTSLLGHHPVSSFCLGVLAVLATPCLRLARPESSNPYASAPSRTLYRPEAIESLRKSDENRTKSDGGKAAERHAARLCDHSQQGCGMAHRHGPRHTPGGAPASGQQQGSAFRQRRAHVAVRAARRRNSARARDQGPCQAQRPGFPSPAPRPRLRGGRPRGNDSCCAVHPGSIRTPFWPNATVLA